MLGLVADGAPDAGCKRKANPGRRPGPCGRQTLALIAEGRSDAGLANPLVVTVATVERDVTGIFGKLGLHRSAEAHRRVPAVQPYLRA